MKVSNLNGLEEDLNRGTKENNKHGGVSDTLRSIMRRPDNDIVINIDKNKYSKNWEKIKWQIK